MGIRMSTVFGWLASGAALAGAADGLSVVYKPLRVGGVQEFGRIEKGQLISTPVVPLRKEWIDHFGTFLTAEAIVEERLRLEIGLGGIFQFGKPERVDEIFGGSQYKMFFIGPSVARGTFLFGDPENPAFTLGGGMFPYKYNPDAANLGEYLFRTGPYPTFIMNGGLLAIGETAAYLQGLHGSARLGNLSLDLLFTTETGMPPLFDWSLAALAGYSIADGLLEVGAGVNFMRILPVDPDRTLRKEKGNSYFSRGGRHYVGDEAYYAQQKSFWETKQTKAQEAGDAAAAADYGARAASFQADVDSLAAWTDPVTGQIPGSKYFTPAGTLVMGRISLDPKKFLGSARLKKDDLRLYAEAAVLGWNNYPVFYENRGDRIPLMVGFNVPTFGLFDKVALQIERFTSPFMNNSYPLGGKNYATPYYPSGGEPLFSKDEYNDLSKEDDWAWSVLVQRSLFHGVTLSAQFARDHLRTVGTDWFYGSRLEPTEDLHRLSDWYWMVQLSWGI